MKAIFAAMLSGILAAFAAEILQGNLQRPGWIASVFIGYAVVLSLCVIREWTKRP